MGSEWKEFILEDLAEHIPNAMATGPFGSSISSKFFRNSGIPVIRGSNLSIDVGHRMSDDGLVYLEENKAKEFSRSVVRAGDVIFTCWGTINQVGIITENLNYSEYIISNKQMKFTPDRNKVNPLFMYYLFSGPTKQAEILQNGIGAAVPGFNLGQLKAHRVLIPSLPEQLAIVHILGSLDDKIELNRRMNATLEAMAQALFKSWFVDFDPVLDNALAAGNPIPEPLQPRAQARAALGDKRTPLPAALRAQFPNRFVFHEDMGWIPEGWNWGELSAFASLATQSVLPFQEPDKLWTHFSIPAFDEGQHPSRDLGSTIKSGKYLVPATAVLASKLNPQFPRVWMPVVEDERTAICSTEFMPFVPNEAAERPFLYAFFLSDIIQKEIINRVTGSTGSRQRVKPKEIADLPVIVVPSFLRKAFSNIVGALFSRQAANKSQEQDLAQLRDTLLPKLLSGQLRVPEAERQAAAML